MKMRKSILSSLLTLAFVCVGNPFVRAECDEHKSGDAERYFEVMTGAKKDAQDKCKKHGLNSSECVTAKQKYEDCRKVRVGTVLGESLITNSLVEEVEEPSEQYPSVKLEKQ